MTNEECIKEAMAILARGGRLVVAKNVSLPALAVAHGGASPLAIPLLGVKVQVCEWLPDDAVIAVAPEADSKWLEMKFSAPRDTGTEKGQP
jgi:hypothetical protein